MNSTGAGGTSNTVAGGIQYGPVLQGRDFHNTTFNTIQVAAAPVALAQLPAPVAGFTGRETELAEVTRILDPAAEAGAVVVSAVAGLAGVGKTALAIQAAHAARAAGWFGGGVLFINLHGYDEQAVQPGRALDALLRALGIPAEHIPQGTEERAALYRSALATISDPMLVVVDNASSEAQVRPLLPGVGPHRVLVTSRHTLAGLGARLLDVQVLDEQAAIVMLEQALRAARPDDNRITMAARRLAEVCGGLPLALRITAALLAADPAMTAGELADLLADEISRLDGLHYDDGGGSSAPSVAAAFELSYKHLDGGAAELFRLLSINPGPDVSTAAAAALADQPVYEARSVLGRLVKAHLIESAGPGAGRWRMHDLLRLYARQLTESHTESGAEELEQARDRLLAYYSDGARAGDEHLRTLVGMPAPDGFSSRKQALAWLDAERPNLIAATALAARIGREEIAVRLPLNLGDYLRWRRRFDELLSVLAISRDAARRLNDRASEARAMNFAGIALQETWQLDEAITAHQDAATIYQGTGDRHGRSLALNNLGAVLTRTRRFDEAILAYGEAAITFQEIGDRPGEGMALANLGVALHDIRRFEEAIIAHRKALAICQVNGDRTREGTALNSLGNALQGAGRLDEAITAHEEALAICRETEDRHRENMALDSLGTALRKAGRFDQAITAHEEALAICRETEDRRGEAAILINLGVALGHARRFDEAITASQDAAAICRETRDRHGEGIVLVVLGFALAKVRRFDEAIIAHEDAVAIFQETGDEHNENLAREHLKIERAERDC